MKLSPAAYAKSHIPPPGHQRTYILSSTIAQIANGVFVPIYVLWCTHIVGIPYTKTALAITIGGLVGLPLTLLAGDLADRLGPRRVVLFGLSGQLLGMGSYVFIQGFWSLLAVIAGMNIFAFSYFASVGALMRRVGGEDTVAFRAQVRTFANIGIALGALGAGVGIDIGTRDAYRAMFLSVAAAYLIAIIILLRIPNYGPLPRPESVAQAKVSRWVVLRDKPYIAYALAVGGMGMSNFVVDLLIPVWIVVYTSAPRWTVATVYIINTGMTILLQLRLSRNIKSTRQGGWALRRAGVTLMAGYLVLATMAHHAAWLATILVLAGAVLLTLAEIWLVSGRFALEFNLPPAYAQGQYDGLLSTVTTLSITAAPMVLIGLVLARGVAGWIGLGSIFLLLGLLSPAIAAWAERTRPKTAAPPQTTAESDEADAATA